MGQDDVVSDPPRDRGTRPEDRPVDQDAVRRLEQIPDLATSDPTGPASGRAPARPALGRPVRARNNLVTTAGVVLVVVGSFVALAAVLAVAPSDGLDLFGVDLDGGTAAAVFLGLAALYAVTGVLVALRRPIGRPLGFVVGALALLIGLAQLPSAGVNGIPTIGVAAFVLYALAIGGSEFRRE
jgi:hypothetical protein